MPVELRQDAGKNRLYLVLSGAVGDEELRAAVDRLVELVASLRPGLTAVTDLSACRLLSPAGVAEVKRAAQACAARGLLAAARVVPTSTVPMLHFNRASHEEGYLSFTVTSLAEADRLLDEEERMVARRRVVRQG